MFSIITPSFNQARFLEQTILSVLGQGVPAEHIVIDGASTDGTVQLLETYSDRLAHWRSRRDDGQTDALNQGMSFASRDIVGWINSDDYYLPGAFEAVRMRFAAPDNPDVVMGYSVTVDKDGGLLRENRHGSFSLACLAQLGMDVNQQSMFWRRELNHKLFPLDTKLRFCMDLQLLARLGKIEARVALIPTFLGAFRLHGASKTSTLDDVRRAEEEQILGALRSDLRNRGALPPRWLLHVRRRLELASRGELKYVLLGGRRGLSLTAKHASARAAIWRGNREHCTLATET